MVYYCKYNLQGTEKNNVSSIKNLHWIILIKAQQLFHLFDWQTLIKQHLGPTISSARQEYFLCLSVPPHTQQLLFSLIPVSDHSVQSFTDTRHRASLTDKLHRNLLPLYVIRTLDIQHIHLA